MQRCHACQHEFTASDIAAGKCPGCGAEIPLLVRRWFQDKTEPEEGEKSESPEPSRPALDESLDILLADDSSERPVEAPPSDLMQTIDTGLSDTHAGETVERAIESASPKPESQAPGQPAPGVTKPKPPTIDDRIDGTIEFDAPEEQSSSKPTIEEPLHRATHPIEADFTIDFGGDDPDLNAHMTSEWASAVAPELKQSQTLRQSGTVSEFISKNARSSLPVKNRSVRKSKAEGEMTPLIPGDIPDYELLEMIGKGGMGVVYAAHQSSIARTVAIKMLKPGTKVGPEARDKFISEAVVTGDLDHPNIVPIYDMGANDEGALFYSMKRVKGTPWDDVLGEKSLDENLNILMRVADAVAFAHAGGVVHRDLKPENVMLGDFGEVLVMDWGLARVTSTFRNAAAIYQAESLGGTPAYMAPEMARGPVENIDHRSDVYLLGAMLYEIVGGIAPHSGRDVMQCLMAAANNKIEPIEQSGELVDIALKAMATKPDDRYPGVKEFQAAVRQYQSHSESLVLAANAQQHLKEAQAQNDYKLYARALYGCQEALALWGGNHKAADLLEQTQLTYAGAALEKEDYDLGLSLLSGDTPEQTKLLAELEKGKRERLARERRLKLFKRLAVGAAAAFLAVVTYSYFEISKQKSVAENQRNEAVKQRGIAVENEGKAVAAKSLAEEQRELALAAKEEERKQREEADLQRAKAEKNEKFAKEQEGIAKQEEAKAKEQEAIAQQQRQLAERAKIAEEYEAYVARIGLAAAKIDENAFDSARDILAECDPSLRNWEWGRLHYLCGLSPQSFEYAGPVEAVAYSPDGTSIVSGDWDGRLIVRDAASGKEKINDKLAQYVHSVAYSADGSRLAAGCSDGKVRLLDASTGTMQREIAAHPGGVLSVAFSPDGARLLTSGYDDTAALWDLASGELVQRLTGHGWWVWSAAFSPDATRIVTASQDGKAIVWRLDTATGEYSQLTMFDGHDGPVYSAALSPDGGAVASAGYDNTICLWSPADVQATNLAARVEGAEEATPEFQRLEGHRGPVRAVVFSADGKRLLSASYDNSLRLWDVQTAQPIKTLRGHGSGVRACAFSPDDQWAASGGQDQRVRLWDIAGYEESRVLRGRVLAGHADAVLSARFSADGQQIITASRDRTGKLWSARDGSLLHTFQEGHEFLASSAQMFADGRRLATGAGDNSVRVWDVAAGAELFDLRPTGRAGALAVSPDGEWIVTGGPNSQTRIWPARQGAEPVVLSGHMKEVTAAAVSPDSTLAATGDDRGLICLWKLSDGKWQPSHVMKGHSRTITALRFADGDLLVSASGDNTCGQWNVATGQELRQRVLRHPEWVSSLDVTPDGRHAITSCDDGRARVWRLADAQEVAVQESPGGVFTCVNFSPDGQAGLLTSSADRQVRSWDWTAAGSEPEIVIDWRQRGGQLWAARFAGRTDHVLTIGGNDAQLWDLNAAEPIVRFSPHGVVSSAALSSNGRLAATASWDNSIKLWDAATGKAVRKLEDAHGGYVNSVAFSPVDNAQLLSASDDGTAILWSLREGAGKLRTLAGHKGRVHQAVYSADGARVLTVGSDKTARLWDARTGKELQVFKGHEWAVLCGALSNDGARVLTGSQDNTAIVWDAATGRPLQTLSGHTASVTSVAFSEEGARALTGSQDRAAKLWDAETGKEILTLGGHTREVTSVAFSPDGRNVLTASRDGSAILWLAEPWNAPPVAAAK